MDNSITLDNEIVNAERKKLNLISPSAFPNYEITTEIFHKSLPLITLQFDDSVVTKKILNGYKQIGVSIHLQINRLNTVIGLEHINWIFRTKELGTSTSSKNKTTYAYSSDCILQIGNRKSYTNIDGIPGSTFIPIYECRGIGYSENINQGTAEKNAITNAKKECLKCLGMLNYLYVDEDDTNEQETEQITESKSNNFLKSKLQLLSNPTINFQNVIVLKASAVDLNCNENVELIAYKDDYENPNHINFLEKLKNIELKTRDIIYVSYLVNQQHSRKQYILKDINK